ncbi:MAG: Holliday junction resolvase RuvX [Prevotellaceae bacterium]|jgi:putative Holliday junction resolvase|nr:Holliday junction resolvase RuvX [Prevotellaceae bacterium]
MARIVAIDYGLKRTGLAVTDPLQLIATPLATVDTTALMDYLKEYAGKEAVECFVVGYPKNLDNTPAAAARHVDPFLQHLRRQFPGVGVVLEDERFTSKIAFRAMIDGGVKKMDRRNKGMVDRVSAVIILQSYLERKQ